MAQGQVEPQKLNAVLCKTESQAIAFASSMAGGQTEPMAVNAVNKASGSEVCGRYIGYAVVESQWNRGCATAAVKALVTKAREASVVRRIVAHTPLERPESGRVLEKAGFAMVREVDDADEDGNAVRVKEWELAV